MKRLIKKSEVHEQTEINGKDVTIYNNPTSNEIRDAIQKSSTGSLRGLITDTDIYVWPSDFDALQVKLFIRDNFETGYQFQTTGNGYIKIFRNSLIREDEIRAILISYYSYFVNFIDTQNAELEIINYISGENQLENSYSTKFNDFIDR